MTNNENVYLVYWCNNEPYEDYCETVEAVYSSFESAVSFITSLGYKPHVYNDKNEKLYPNDRFDLKIDNFGTCWSMWVREIEINERIANHDRRTDD